MNSEPVHVAFVCVQNAGRSQMASAFAERERRTRDLETEIEVITGGTRPGDHVHDVVVGVMNEVGFDLTDCTPRSLTPDELERTDIVVTMGCSADDVCPATWPGENRDWALTDPAGKDHKAVRDIRDEIERRVKEFLDELEPVVTRRV